MTQDPWTTQVEAFGRFATGQRRLAQRRLRELSARQAQRQVIVAARASQRPLVDAVRLWASAVERSAPALPALSQPDGPWHPRAIVRSNFELAEQLLRTQHAFADRLLAAARPVLDKKA